MAETVEEQMEYGSYCMHGRNLGTPGGADLMCGDCEAGYTHWYDDPQYGLFFGFNQEPISSVGRTWRQSDLDSGLTWAYISDRVEFTGYDENDDVRQVMRQFQWQVKKINDGYWDTPPPSPEVINERLHDATWHALGTGDLPRNHGLPDDLVGKLADLVGSSREWTRLLEAVDQSVSYFLEQTGLVVEYQEDTDAGR